MFTLQVAAKDTFWNILYYYVLTPPHSFSRFLISSRLNTIRNNEIKCPYFIDLECTKGKWAIKDKSWPPSDSWTLSILIEKDEHDGIKGWTYSWINFLAWGGARGQLFLSGVFTIDNSRNSFAWWISISCLFLATFSFGSVFTWIRVSIYEPQKCVFLKKMDGNLEKMMTNLRDQPYIGRHMIHQLRDWQPILLRKAFY